MGEKAAKLAAEKEDKKLRASGLPTPYRLNEDPAYTAFVSYLQTPKSNQAYSAFLQTVNDTDMKPEDKDKDSNAKTDVKSTKPKGNNSDSGPGLDSSRVADG